MRKLLQLICLSLCAFVAVSHASEAWPSRPVRLIVPLPPGGGGDALARITALELGRRLGQPVAVENRAGASGIIGTQAVANAAADGYTLLFATDFHAINGAFGKLPYDAIKGFVPIAQLVELQILLLARPDLGAKSLGDVLAMAKKEPRRVTFGAPGTGSPHFLASKLLQQRAAVEFLDVPYQGTGPVTTAFLGGQVDLMFSGVGAGMKLVESGKAVPLAVSGVRRDGLAPAVPTVAESGHPGYSITSWMGLLAPAGTPEAVVSKINHAVRDMLADKSVVERLAGLGFVVSSGTPQTFGELIRTDIDKLRGIIQAAGVAAER